MAFDIVMFGAFTIPETNVEAWLSTPIEPESFSWLEDVAGEPPTQDTPEALVTALQALVCAPHEFLSLSLHEGRVQLQAYLSEDRYREAAQAVALLTASAADFGGVGEVHFMGYQGIRFAERFTLRGGRATFARLTAEQLSALEHRPAFQLLEVRIHERFDALVGRPSIGDARGSQWVVNPFTGRKVRAATGPGLRS